MFVEMCCIKSTDTGHVTNQPYPRKVFFILIYKTFQFDESFFLLQMQAHI